MTPEERAQQEYPDPGNPMAERLGLIPDHKQREVMRAAFLKGYAAGQRDRWIPVSERLPEKGLTVLAYDPGCLIHTMQYHAGFEHPWRDCDPSDGGSFSSLPNVTHWMPLPSPPQP